MIDYYKKVYWHDERLDGNNNGFVYGIYYYQDEDDFPVDVEWFESELDRDTIFDKLNIETNEEVE